MEASTEKLIRQAAYNASLIQGWTSLEELQWLARQALTRKTIIEVGCWRGRSTKAMIGTCPGTVYSIDDFRGTDCSDSPSAIDLTDAKGAYIGFSDSFRKNIRLGKLVLIKEDTVHAISKLKDSNVIADMVFVDASHDYISVKRDIEACLPLVAKGGLLCGHDYANIFPGLKQAVHELVPGFIYGDAGSIWHKIV